MYEVPENAAVRGRLDSGLRPGVAMPGWRSLMLRVAIGVVVLDLGALGLHASGARPAALAAIYALAVAGVGWLIASYMMLRALEADERETAASAAAAQIAARAAPPTRAAAAGAVAPASAVATATAPVPTPTAPPDNATWTRLVEGCVELVEELDHARSGFDPAQRELTEHVLLRLEEILDHPGVEVIRGETTFARDRHKADRKADDGAPIAETLSPGFALGRRVLRRARVRIARETEHG